MRFQQFKKIVVVVVMMVEQIELGVDTNEAEHAKVEEVLKVVTAAKLMTEVVTNAEPITTAAQVPKASAPRRRRGVVIQDPKETAATSVIMHSEVKSKDKGKGILIEEPKPLKGQAQIDMDKAFARQLEAELKANITWNDVIDKARKNMMIYLKNMAGFNMDFFKGITYSDIRSIFEKHYNSIQDLLEKGEEEVTIQEEASKRKVNDDDDIYTEATPLASKVHVVDYQIHHENNKPYYKIFRADGTHKLFLSFINLLKNYDREDLETLWKLLKERFESTKPKNFSDDFLLSTLKIMFEKPNVEANMILLVEKKYPLTRFTLEKMLNNVRLEVEEESEMSLELLSNAPGTSYSAVAQFGGVINSSLWKIPLKLWNDEIKRLKQIQIPLVKNAVTGTSTSSVHVVRDITIVNSQYSFGEPLRLNVTEGDALLDDRTQLNAPVGGVFRLNEGACSSGQSQDSDCVGGIIENVSKKRQRNTPVVEYALKKARHTTPRATNRRIADVTPDDGEGCSSGQGRGDRMLMLIWWTVIRNGQWSLTAEFQVADFDVIIQEKEGPSNRISKLHKSYMSLQFPLLFIYGQAGFYPELKLRAANGSRQERKVTMLAYYSTWLGFSVPLSKVGKTSLEGNRKIFKVIICQGYMMLFLKVNEIDMKLVAE
nr:helitron helicase-like domain-containing protein [Tanacetum cinerariifolium]